MEVKIENDRFEKEILNSSELQVLTELINNYRATRL